MIINADITLYNKYYSKDEQCTKYIRTYLRGVNWQGKQAVQIGDKGIKSADVISIYIPKSVDSDFKEYISPKKYQYLSNIEKEKYFTLAHGDKIVKGIVDFDLTGIKPNNEKHLEELYDDVVTIISTISNDNGSYNMHHWKVGCE